MADVGTSSHTWMSFVSSLTVVFSQHNCFPDYPELWLHLVPCCLKPIPIILNMQGTIKNRHGHDLHLAERTVPVFVFLLPLRTPQGQNLSKDQFFLQIMPLYDKDHRIADLELVSVKRNGA